MGASFGLGRAAILGGACVLFLAATQGCSHETETSACTEEPIDAFKELVVVDEDLLADDRSKNALTGTWSFRHTIENMMPVGASPNEFVTTWLSSWTNREFNGFPLDRPNESRANTVMERIVCPWLKRTPANNCDETCGTCSARELDLAKAPFRLIGITNRMDLREQVAAAPNGEGRLVYGLTNGAADDPASVTLPMSLIAEYSLPPSRSAKEWADTWHALGKFTSYDEPYRAALESVTNSFTKRGSNPSAPNGSALGQIRTNDSVLNWIWQQREFAIAPDGALRNRALRNTPGESLNNTSVLADFVKKNADGILASRYEMPISMRAGSSDALLFSWQVPGVDAATNRAFAAGTCNGCHSFEHPNVDSAFHMSPLRKGKEKLSPFLYDPAGGPDDIKARTASLQRARCGN